MSNVRYLDPKNDVVFKKIFGDHPHLLKSFLNAVLPLDSDIETLEYLPTEQLQKIDAFKRTIVDVKCKDKAGRVFIVEMQMNWTDWFKQRLLFGTSQAIVKNLKPGQDYHYLQPVYGLGLVNANFYEKQDEWYHHYKLVKQDKDGHQDVIKHLQLLFIELPKFPVTTHDEKKLKILWLRFLREIGHHTKEVSPDLIAVPEIKEALELAAESAFTEGELINYEEYWDAVAVEKTNLSSAEARGRAEGKAEGKAEGIAEATNVIARKMLEAGQDIYLIASITGLSVAEIKILQ